MTEAAKPWTQNIIDQVRAFKDQAVQVGKGAYEGGKQALQSTAPDALRASGPVSTPPITPPNPAGSIGDTIAGAAQESRIPPTAALPPAQRLEATPISQTISQAAAEPQPEPTLRRPAWGAGPSPEAQAYTASRGAVPPVPPAGGATPPPVTPTPPVEEAPGFRGRAAKAAGAFSKYGAGPLALGAEFLHPNVRTAIDPTSDMSVTDRLKQASRSMLRVGGGILGGAGGAALGSVVPVAGTIAGGVAGGAAGYAAGDKAADYLLGPEAKAQAAQGTPATPTQLKPAAPTQVQAAAPETSGFKSLNGPAKVAANKFIAGTDTPAEGSGYIRNNQTGNVAYRKPGPPSGLRSGVGPGGGDELAPFRAGASKGGVHALAALGAYGAYSRQKSNDMNMGLRAAQIQASTDTARARLGYEMAKDQRDYTTGRADYADTQNAKNRDIFDKDVTDYATSLVGAQKAVGIPGMQKGDPTYESQIKAKKADLAGDIKYSLGNRKDGKQYGQLGETDKQQLFLLKKFKDKVVESRGSKTNWAHDFFGNGRADSRDLYSYAPSDAEGSIIPFSGGIRVATKNGNTMTLTDAAGGGFNFTGPNDPADADLMQLMQPAIDRYRKAHEGK